MIPHMEPNTSHSSSFKPNFIFWMLVSILLFVCLGSREIWTQEWRWGEIIRGMLLHHDYFHPSLKGQLYFDKPLLSYWLMLAVIKLTGQLSTWSLRLPSAIAGLVSIACIYQIGASWQNRKTANIAAILLTTTYYFLFWARTASSDMLNMAGILCATAWYFAKREQPGFINYSVFLLILALTALLKGLVAPAIVFLIIAPDVILHLGLFSANKSFRFRRHCEHEAEAASVARQGRGNPVKRRPHGVWKLLAALLPAILIYFLPFWLTSLENHTTLSQNGLYEVYRENILRFFEPFDHKDPIYTYFIYLPVYLLPWTVFFLAALYQLPKRWSSLTVSTQQLAIANACLFLFLTLSGSRRSYYVLPLLPFAILFTAEWISCSKMRIKLTYYTASISFLGLLSWFIFFQPLYYSDGGLPEFSQQLTRLTAQKAPEKIWHVVFVNTDNRLSFYLPQYEITFLNADKLDLNALFKQYDILILREADLQQIKNLSAHYLLFTPPHRGNRWFENTIPDAPVAIFSKEI